MADPFQPTPGTVPAQVRAEVENLYARYNHCSDAGDADGYADCFTPEGVLAIEPLGLRVAGRAALADYKRADVGRRGTRYRRHWNSGLWLEAQPDGTLVGRCYLLAYGGEPGELPRPADAGVYEDTLAHGPDGWRFARRLLRLDGSTFRPPEEG